MTDLEKKVESFTVALIAATPSENTADLITTQNFSFLLRHFFVFA